MNTPTKILHIDADFKITYFFKHPGGSSHSLVSLNQAIQLLKTEEFDLILSEPHHKAILKRRAPTGKERGLAQNPLDCLVR